LVGAGCGPQAGPLVPPDNDDDQVVQAIIEFGDDEPRPFLADSDVQTVLYPTGVGGQLLVHACTDGDPDRLALALVFELDDPALPGTVDLSNHAIVLMELDRSGQAKLVLDGIPEGTAEIHGTLEPGREVNGTFSATLPGTDEMGNPLVARLDGSFSAVIASDAESS